MREIASLTKSHRPRKTPKTKKRKSTLAKESAPARKKSAANPALAGVRPPPPDRGKRGEKGYLGYLLRQAQAAARLSLERALADLGITTPQFVVLTMLRANPGLSGADQARVALLTPQTVGVIIRNLERSRAIRKTPHPQCRRRAMVLERRLTAGLGAKGQATVRRWLSKIAAELSQGG